MSATSAASGTGASLARSWDDAVAAIPADWTDLYAEVELVATDDLERAALALAPVNPARHGDVRTLRFRVARKVGYGAAVGMARRCLERLDEQQLPGTLRILRVLSDTRHAQTQGPVWLLDGRVV